MVENRTKVLLTPPLPDSKGRKRQKENNPESLDQYTAARSLANKRQPVSVD